jgi:hypothetical protein
MHSKYPRSRLQKGARILVLDLLVVNMRCGIYFDREGTDFKKKVTLLTNRFQKEISKDRELASAPEHLREFKREATAAAVDEKELAVQRALLVSSIGSLGIYNFAGTGVQGNSGDGGNPNSAKLGSQV